MISAILLLVAGAMILFGSSTSRDRTASGDRG